MHNLLEITLVDRLILSFVLILFVPIGVLLLECLAALLPMRSPHDRFLGSNWRPTVTVLLPAHNEEAVIGKTIAGILRQLTPQDQLLVIADNCSDRTAQVARNFGATVIERNNLEQRGKGFALDYGLHFIADNPPEVVVILDADCDIEANYITAVAQSAYSSQRPVQPINLLRSSDQSDLKSTISEFAFMVKNLVRPQGLAQLNMPCLVTMGTAFPWSVINQVPLSQDNLVEDMQFGIDLAIAGNPPLFCAAAKVTGVLPRQNRAATTQRTRWEQGHILTLFTQAPRLFKEAGKQKRFDLLFLALDLSIPPLSFLVAIWFAMTTIAVGLGFLGNWTAAIAAGIEGGLLLLAIALAWLKFGRKVIPLKSLLSIPGYILWKLPIYSQLLVEPEQQWIRTERDLPNVTIPEFSPGTLEIAEYSRSE